MESLGQAISNSILPSGGGLGGGRGEGGLILFTMCDIFLYNLYNAPM